MSRSSYRNYKNPTRKFPAQDKYHILSWEYMALKMILGILGSLDKNILGEKPHYPIFLKKRKISIFSKTKVWMEPVCDLNICPGFIKFPEVWIEVVLQMY